MNQTKKNQNLISIVIPVWNSELQLKKNFPSVIVAAQSVKAEIVIVDDASSDHSLAYLQQYKAKIKNLKLIANQQNLGFGQTVNRGVKASNGNIVVLLNTDVRPRKDCFLQMLPYFNDPNVFAVTFNSGEDTARGYWANGLFHHSRHPIDPNKKTHYSLWACGGQAAFDRAKWQKLNGMDDLYAPFYWEDTDLGYRAWKRGWSILWTKDCVVVHDHAKSVIKNNFPPSYIKDIAQRNQFLFIWKNITSKRLILAHLLALPRFFLRYPIPIIEALFLLPKVLYRRFSEKKFAVRSDEEILALWQK